MEMLTELLSLAGPFDEEVGRLAMDWPRVSIWVHVDKTGSVRSAI